MADATAPTRASTNASPRVDLQERRDVVAAEGRQARHVDRADPVQRAARNREGQHQLRAFLPARVRRLRRAVALLPQRALDARAHVFQQVLIDGAFFANRRQGLAFALGQRIALEDDAHVRPGLDLQRNRHRARRRARTPRCRERALRSSPGRAALLRTRPRARRARGRRTGGPAAGPASSTARPPARAACRSRSRRRSWSGRRRRSTAPARPAPAPARYLPAAAGWWRCGSRARRNNSAARSPDRARGSPTAGSRSAPTARCESRARKTPRRR